MINSCCTSLRAQVWRRGRFRSKTGALPIGAHHGMRNARLYGLLVSKLCFGTLTFGNGRGPFKAISTVDQAGADEPVKTSNDGASTSLIRRTITLSDHVRAA
jgi:hypothetical protein